MIPYARQDINDADIQAVVEVLQSDWLTQGPTVERFEQAVAAYCGSAHSVATNNGTSALHLACQAIGLGPGDLLWSTPNTFVASLNCARHCSADVDFVDIDPRTYNMSVDALERKLASAAERGRMPKAIMPVHFAGQPCEMEEIGRLAGQYGAIVIEDASHAVGAQYRGRPIGECKYSDVAVFSFHPVKIVTTGEGGMLVTQRADLADRARLLRSHGVTRDPSKMRRQSEGPWYYEQLELGYNYRMTDIQAALGYSQLSRIDAFVARRHALAARYAEGLEGLPLRLPWQHPGAASSWHLYVIRLNVPSLSMDRAQVVRALREAGINVNVHYIPVHTQPYYEALGFRRGDFPEAEAYYAEAISLPMYAGLREDDQDRVIQVLNRILS